MRSALLILALAACTSDPIGLIRSEPAATTVKFDFFHRPLPEIPLPNDLATRFDARSATNLRLNVSQQAPTELERRVRRLVDTLDGWGVLQPISIPFTGPLDAARIREAHGQDDYAIDDDLIFLINIDRDSPELGRVHHLDLGKNNHPPVIENLDGYWRNDPRGFTISMLFEEEEEDLDGDGELDPEEDTDLDGVLDHPNYLPGLSPARTDLAGRADALMTFYEAETDTLIARPLEPLRERTRYAVVVTKRLTDAGGEAVGSPFEYVHHLAQRDALDALPEVLPEGVALEDVAFAFSYTTESLESSWIAVRDGLYGHGVQAAIGEQFPPEIAKLEIMRDKDAFPNMTNPYLVHSETVLPLIEEVQERFRGLGDDSLAFASLVESYRSIDYIVVGRFSAPQLAPELDANGALLPMDERSWPPDLDRVPVTARPEDVFFTLVVPRKEISPRGRGEPADVVLLGHGYGGNRFDAINLGGYFARHGLAVLAIDGPGHGLEIDPLLRSLVEGLFDDHGLEPMAKALLSDRSRDLNGDLQTDPGAEFWTAYLFHTRDVVRQFVFDNMSLVRIVRTFDGVQRWKFDVDRDGEPELAGDFDGDGQIDIGGSAKFLAAGGSLGGMTSVLLGSLEPQISTSAPIAAGGTLGNIGTRSTVGGVRVALMLRSMGPLFLATRDPVSGQVALTTIVPDLNREGAELSLASVGGVALGDVMLVENLSNGEARCGRIDGEGRARVGLPSDRLDAVRVTFYGAGEVTGGDHCEVAGGAAPKAEVSTFEATITFQTEEFSAGTQLVALAEGLGVRRGHPELRRFQGIAQLVLDPADPAVFARHLFREPLFYPGTGEQTGSHLLLTTTIGDTSVPADSGMAIARAAGLLPYLEADPRYGKPANQVLLDWHIAESSDTYPRYFDRQGRAVHADVEGFDRHTASWADDTTYLDPPLRLGFDERDPLGGKSAAIFPLTDPLGAHGFAEPFTWLDRARDACLGTCTSTETGACECAADGYDVGNFMLNMIGRYLRSDGHDLRADGCMSTNTCDDEPTVPMPRSMDEIR